MSVLNKIMYKLVPASLLVAAFPVMAAAGFTKANALLEKVKTGLLLLSIVTVTLAVLWVGYKVLFGGSTLKECSPIIIGAVLIASASEIARMLVG